MGNATSSTGGLQRRLRRETYGPAGPPERGGRGQESRAELAAGQESRAELSSTCSRHAVGSTRLGSAFAQGHSRLLLGEQLVELAFHFGSSSQAAIDHLALAVDQEHRG